MPSRLPVVRSLRELPAGELVEVWEEPGTVEVGAQRALADLINDHDVMRSNVSDVSQLRVATSVPSVVTEGATLNASATDRIG